MKRVIYFLTAFAVSVTGITQQPYTLSKQEEEAILYMREEEKLARDVYDFLYARWSVNPFGNIRRSEQRHMDIVNTYNYLIGASYQLSTMSKSSDAMMVQPTQVA
jgi:hypothetical protein